MQYFPTPKHHKRIILSEQCVFRVLGFCKILHSHWLALGSPGWLFNRLSPCRKWLNTQTNSCWLRPVQPSTPQFSLLQPTTAQFSLVKTSTVQYSPLQPSRAQHSPVQPNTPHYIPEQPSTALYRPVQPSTAQYCPVQHSAVHYSPPPPVEVKVYHHVHISTLSWQSFAQKQPGLVFNANILLWRGGNIICWWFSISFLLC